MGRTHEALLRAEKQFQKNLNQKKSSENIEPLLMDLGLGETQILNQNPNQLKQSLARLNGLILKQESSHTSDLTNDTVPDADIKRSVLRGLLKRKELVLGCMDMLFANNIEETIRKLVDDIPDRKLKTALIRNLNNLRVLDKFLIKEHVKVLQSKKRMNV